MPNFSFLACVEVAEKFVVAVVGGGLTVSTMSNLNPSCIEFELGLEFDNIMHNSVLFHSAQINIGFRKINYL